MRTTITLDDDVAQALVELQARDRIGLSRALNELARRGMTAMPIRERFTQRTFDMGTSKIPLDDIAGALDAVDGAAAV